jgi:hypothetical protein
VLRFTTTPSLAVQQLTLAPIAWSVNRGRRSLLVIRRGGDTGTSSLSLPAPLMRLAADKVTYLNGECERVLLGRSGVSKVRVLEIVALRPQPVVGSSGTALELDLRNLPLEGARAELISVDGDMAAMTEISGGDRPLVRRRVSFGRVAPGAYLLRVVASSGTATSRIVVVE